VMAPIATDRTQSEDVISSIVRCNISIALHQFLRYIHCQQTAAAFVAVAL